MFTLIDITQVNVKEMIEMKLLEHFEARGFGSESPCIYVTLFYFIFFLALAIFNMNIQHFNSINMMKRHPIS